MEYTILYCTIYFEYMNYANEYEVYQVYGVDSYSIYIYIYTLPSGLYTFSQIRTWFLQPVGLSSHLVGRNWAQVAGKAASDGKAPHHSEATWALWQGRYLVDMVFYKQMMRKTCGIHMWSIVNDMFDDILVYIYILLVALKSFESLTCKQDSTLVWGDGRFVKSHTPLTRYIICFFLIYMYVNITYTIQVQLGQAMEINITIISRIIQNSDDEPCIASTKIHDQCWI